MVSKVIPVAPIKALNGRPYRVPKRNEDGEVIWKDRDKGVPELEEATTVTLIQSFLPNIPRSIQSARDPDRVPQMWHRLDVANGKVELHDKLYDWLHRLLKREVAPAPADKERGAKPVPYCQELWDMNARCIVEQLKDLEERKDILEESEDSKED